MGRPLLGISALAVITAATTLPQPSRAEPKAVIELFTSQGCSSCPPADKMLGELARDDGLVTMTLPIDYWDYLGWKDTLARPRHTVRQRGYAAVRGDREVYTPQMVVNGMRQVLGSDRRAIEAALAQTRDPPMLTIPVTVSGDADRLVVTVEAAHDMELAGEVWVCALAKTVAVKIARGENSGHTMTYHNVVRRWIKLGAWDGTRQSWTVPKTVFDDEGIDSVAVLLQAGMMEKPGAVLGAAVATLH